ncbi:hypothetical protein HN51_056259 [Arachis hypogaea]|uniref:Uncharacterized protein n=1 Tax=Arachis hypogaea TaxID=3818 RepID=A0A444XT97_ARAHY|nr:uncharacterized protein LOC107616867 [Arachis ipaensis]XP_025680073.1 uncharacterized protein LOC112779939 [Arachis hypogaea]QHN79082.1 uncharacterized protein DS421_19g667020 [Arachis hypogaea]RYQ92990.1 hypothetical protein Ahy_B09g099242 [Arachis hypogaea]
MEMSSPSMKREEADDKRRIPLYNPCYLLEEALNALLKCLGFETTTAAAAENKKKEEKNVHLKPHSDADLGDDDDISTLRICECDTNMKASYQQDEDPPSSTSQDDITTDSSLAARRRPVGDGRPGLSGGSGPQHN